MHSALIEACLKLPTHEATWESEWLATLYELVDAANLSDIILGSEFALTVALSLPVYNCHLNGF